MKKTGLIILLLLFCTFTLRAQEAVKKITLDAIHKQKIFRSHSVRGLRSMKDGEHFTTLQEQQKITKYNYKTGDVIEILFNAPNSDFRIKDYTFSSDESKILLAVNAERIYRRSYKADFYIYDLQSKSLDKLSENGKQMFAAFSPNAFKIAFVRDNNIFISDLKTKEEKQITFDGKFNHIINGGTDWVYEEEFAFTKAFFWSPNGNKIAYYKFNETAVPVFNMTRYNNDIYPENYAFKYPKAGEKNSIVSVHVYDLKTAKTQTIDVGSETDQYIARVKWTTIKNKLAIIRENRLQNHIEILISDAEKGNSKVIYSEKNKYYIKRIEDWYMTTTNDGKYFIINSEKSGRNHLYLYDLQGNLVNQITQGNWEVTGFIGLDNKTKTVYYQSTEESPLNRAVYSIKLDGSKKKKISTRQGTNSAKFSNGFKYYINYYNDVNTPNYITLHNKKGKLIRVLEDNKALKDKMLEYGFVKAEAMVINTPSSKWDLNTYILKPVNFNPEKKYPLLIFQYSGPGSQTAANSWLRNMAWHQMLVQKGYIVAYVDVRGSGGRGEKFRKMTYGQLGKYETIDHTEVARYLSSLRYIDENRTGIWGWSYGGFMSASCLLRSADVFEMAVAVAPVTSYRFYDSIYTELYMGLPKDNAEGYDNNALLTHVDKLKGKLLLIHGTGDDNVHVQNTIELARKLTEANKSFDMHLYTDKDHSIRGSNTRLHLFTMITNYIIENL